MNPKTWTRIIAMTLFAALALPLQLAAQGAAKPHHPSQYHHYQISDPGTFGGPNDYLQTPGLPRAGVLNNRGTLVGAANTSGSDYPYCGFGNCYAGDAFQLQDGVTTDLGRLPGGFDSQVNWISQSGLMTGAGDNGQPDPLSGGALPQIHGLFWENGSLTDMGTLPEGGYVSFPVAVNNRGEVVGNAQNTVPDLTPMYPTDGTQTRAFYWKNGVTQDMGTLGGTDAAAALINDRGQVVGWSYTNSTPSAICGAWPFGFSLTTSSFIWDKKNGMRDIGGLGGTCTVATDLSNQGQVVGLSAVAGDLAIHPFVWDAETGMTDLLGASSGDNAYWAITINEHGVVAGGVAGPSHWNSFIWRNTGGKWKRTNLGRYSVPTSINESGEVIGYGNFPFVSEDDGPLVDLNTLIPPNSGLTLYETAQINDRGEISVQGPDANNNNHSVLLIPCDDNHPGVEGCDYSMVDAATARQNAALRYVPNTMLHSFRSRMSNRFSARGLPSQSR